MTGHVKVTKADGVLRLVLNRPDKKNALTDAMYGVLADEITGAQTDTAVRVIMIRGEGDMFTAGNDIAEFAAAKPGDGARNVGRFIRAIAEIDKPLMAAVQGRAVGVGTTMLLHCDHVILADDAKLTTPFANLGLVPEAASSMLLPARIGHLRAFSMLALGEAVEAKDALAWGLASAIVPVADLVDAIEAAAARVARQALGAVQATKRLMRDAAAMTAHMDIEGKEFLQRLQSPEAREAFMAFAQRRAPDFTQFA
ncbi:enoyl-CoA hydratase-related protein [Agrobacterium deltaense]|uniref:enoyl-CoA hydratase-related protein n=1 Tax=Agrobacterium deltaense TaxID=1183412 RepID=UPI000F634AD4|nr:enoyl-CoA hydratase-related protein [Agrobacterium deltaense]RRN74620.1 enoyl-CoA hydratase [Agrobacterium deltaense]